VPVTVCKFESCSGHHVYAAVRRAAIAIVLKLLI